MHRPIAAIALFAAAAATVAGVRVEYTAPDHAPGWAVEGSDKHSCALSQTIPHYGVARFSRESGKQLLFTLRPNRAPDVSGTARIYSVPPAWKHSAFVRDFGAFDYAADKPFRLYESVADQLLRELEQGMFLALGYTDSAVGRDEVTVEVSSVGIRERLTEFRRCIAELVPPPPPPPKVKPKPVFVSGDVNRTLLHFEPYITELNEDHIKRLNEIAEAVKADKAVAAVAIDAYTDSSGKEELNSDLSRKRGEATRAYLQGQGVAAEVVAVEAHGEKDFVTSNATRAGRDQNRRVLIQLKRQ